jgi:hypothetical protein
MEGVAGEVAHSPDPPSAIIMFPVLKQNPSGHQFKDDRQVRRLVRLWLIRTDMKNKYKSPSHDVINASAVAGSV